uniref:Uncharacterized protein n=1 Tax=Ficus carica TaxID=3494 RepID=A0AA88EFJ8_FICCA|nr:hypothetical protein TIFTF001_054281 [Ficus carica]
MAVAVENTVDRLVHTCVGLGHRRREHNDEDLPVERCGFELITGGNEPQADGVDARKRFGQFLNRESRAAHCPNRDFFNTVGLGSFLLVVNCGEGRRSNRSPLSSLFNSTPLPSSPLSSATILAYYFLFGCRES